MTREFSSKWSTITLVAQEDQIIPVFDVTDRIIDLNCNEETYETSDAKSRAADEFNLVIKGGIWDHPTFYTETETSSSNLLSMHSHDV